MSTDFAMKYATARDRVLAMLSDCQWHQWRELERVGGNRYVARMLELRRLGYSIATVDLHDEGKSYRLVSLERGEPQVKRVKPLLAEADVEELLRGCLTPSAEKALTDALGSFKANRSRL